MLEVAELREALSVVRYRPRWQLVVQDIDDHQGPYLSVYATVPDASGVNEEIVLRIHSPIPPMETEAAFHAWLCWRLRQVAIHEHLEWFQVYGKPWCDPHAAID